MKIDDVILFGRQRTGILSEQLFSKRSVIGRRKYLGIAINCKHSNRSSASRLASIKNGEATELLITITGNGCRIFPRLLKSR